MTQVTEGIWTTTITTTTMRFETTPSCHSVRRPVGLHLFAGVSSRNVQERHGNHLGQSFEGCAFIVGEPLRDYQLSSTQKKLPSRPPNSQGVSKGAKPFTSCDQQTGTRQKSPMINITRLAPRRDDRNNFGHPDPASPA